MKTELTPAVPHLKRLLAEIRKIRVAVIGDLMLDRYLWGTANRLSPEAAVPVVDFGCQDDRVGGAGNVAANLAALGARAQIFGVVGGRKLSGGKVEDDEAGASVRKWLRHAKIGERGVMADPARITSVKTRVIARNQQIVRIDQERRDALLPDTEEKLFRMLLTSLGKTDALLISDYDKGLISDGFTPRILNACHKAEVPVFVKPKRWRFLPYPGARVVVCNKEEAGFYVTRSLDREESFEEAGRELLARFGSAAVVITRGEQGMSVFEENSPRSLTIPATRRQVFDVTGAGDTVLSVLSLAVAAGATTPEAAYVANIAAGVVVGKLGAASVTPAELATTLEEIAS